MVAWASEAETTRTAGEMPESAGRPGAADEGRSAGDEAVRIRVLGPVDLTVDGVPFPLPGLRRKSVLAVLALHPAAVVSSDKLIDLVWESNPPANALNTVQQHISFLRRALRARDSIVARPPGYLLNAPAEAVDVSDAMRLIASGNADDHAGRAALLTEALELWRGPSLADVTEVAWLRDQGRRLDEARLDAVEQLLDARLALGEHPTLVTQLEDLALQHPYREELHRLFMLALYRCGRQADALAAYQRLRDILHAELGIDPSPTLRDLETAILRQDRGLDLPPPAVAVAQGRPEWITPAQLPQALATFSGRLVELNHLHALLPAGPNEDPAPPQPAAIAVMSGTAGVGKTALAIYWSHQVKAWFPDGQLYVDLRGFDPGGAVMDPAEAVRGFLDALGVPRDRIPESPQAQAALYRSVLAGKRILVVADNARDEQQVRPLLPGAPGCFVVVTSREQLSGLVAVDGAHPVTLQRPSVAEARQILARRLGAQCVDAEPQAVDDIITRCARLPLALAMAAAQAVPASALPLAQLAAQLRDAATLLDPFDSPDPATNIRAVFSWSYQALSDAAARLFRLLGLCPGPDTTLPAAASTAGLPVSEVRPLLTELTRAHLLTSSGPGRYGFHDLLRAYAIDQAHRYDTVEQQAAARSRFLDHHLHTAHAASLLLKPGRDPIDLIAAGPGVTPQQLADYDAAQVWFAAERQVLLATTVRAPDGQDRHTWQLAWSLVALLSTRADRWDNLLVQQASLRAARRLGDPTAAAYAHRSLGRAYADLSRWAEARRHNHAAVRLFEWVGNPVAATGGHYNLSTIAGLQGDIDQCLAHAEHAYHSYRSLGDRTGQAHAASNIGWCHGKLGRPDKGLAYCQEALDILLEIEDLQPIAHTWDSLGALHFGVGDPVQGEYCYQQAVNAYRRLGDRYREAATFTNLGDSHHENGNPHAAHQAWKQALAILDDLEPEATAHIRSRLDAAVAVESVA